MNPKNLGYVLKDGTIQFASKGAVFEYAQNMVKKGFNAKEPHEVGVVWKNNRILSVAHGDFYRVGHPKNLPSGCSSMHGHILESPLSGLDYACMMLRNDKELIVLCPSERYSRIVRLPGENINHKSTQRKLVITHKKIEYAECLSELEARCKLMPLTIKDFVKRLLDIKKTNSDVPSEEYIKEFNQKCAPSLARRVAEVFEKLGQESGVRYDSNLISK